MTGPVHPLFPVLAGAMLLTGCARGPTLPQSADALEADARAVLDEGAKRLGDPGKQPRVVADGTRACDDGRAQHVLRGELPLRRGPDVGVTLDQATDVAIIMIRERGYRLESPPHASRTRLRTFAMTGGDPTVRLVINLHGGRRPVLQLTATTSCLSR